MEYTISLYHLICLLSGFLAVSMGFFLLIIKSQSNRANIYLGALLLVYSLFFIPGFLEAIGILEQFPHIIRINFFAGTLTGPLTYLYCKSSTHQNSFLKKEDLIHFVPFLLSFIWFWPTLIKSGAEKLAIYRIVITEGRVPESKMIIVLMTILAFIYTLISIKMVSKYLKFLRNSESNINPAFHRWLLFLSCSLVVPIVVVALITIASSRVVSPLSILSIFSMIVLIIYISLLVKPRFFHQMPSPIPLKEVTKSATMKYKNSYLQDHQKEIYLSRILNCMQSQKPFLDPKLTINQFSDQVGIASYYVSQLINEKLGVNFLDFVNGYRIKDVKSKLSDDELNHFTIITLAYESGFNSKTAFYSTFKKHIGMTPSQYRKEQQTVMG